MTCRGVRGATTVKSNDRDEILEATRQLLALIIRRNDIEKQDLASAFFTLTKDLNAEFPAYAARQLGWGDVPLLCGYELEVPGSIEKCIRVLLHWNTETPASEVQHVYAREAERLRPDLDNLPEVDLKELDDWINQQMQAADG